MDWQAGLFLASVLVLPVLTAITFHEAAHGYVAARCGDDTAWRLGRVTFNPLKHIDPLGTVLVPALMFFTTSFLFGWAKPVPVDFRRLNRPRTDMVWVAAAGPAVNLALALVAGLLLHIVPHLPEFLADWAGANLQIAILINVILAMFNLIPLPPLDGGRIAVGLLPDVLAVPLARLERVGLFLLIGILFIVPLVGSQLGQNWSILPWLLDVPVDIVGNLILVMTGHGAG